MNSVILLAGGTGTRIGNSIPKQFMILAGKPVIMHTLERLDESQYVDEIVIVCHKDYIDNMNHYIETYMLENNYKIIEGGSTRQESVYKGLMAAKNENIVIHEAARPFVKKDEFNQIITNENPNIMYGLDIPFTVVEGHNNVEGILDRSSLVNVQLPQKFNRKLLLTAHKQAIRDKLTFTEDASLLYHYSKEKIEIIKGKPYNIKITNPLDILIGEVIYKEYIIGRD